METDRHSPSPNEHRHCERAARTKQSRATKKDSGLPRRPLVKELFHALCASERGLLAMTAFTILLLTAFTCALFFTGYMNILYAPALVALLIIAGFIAISSIWRGLIIPSGAPVIALLAFWLYITASLLWTSVPFASTVTWLILTAMPLLFFTLLTGDNREVRLTYAAGALMAALTLLAGWALIDYLFFGGGIGHRAHAGQPNPNILAGLINLGFLPALALFLSAQNHKFLKLLLTLLFFAALLATESRGGIISGGGAAAVLFFSLRPCVDKQKILSLLITTALIFTAFQFAGQSGERLAALTAPAQEKEITSRVAIWQSTLAIIKDHPLTGTGLGSFHHVYPAYRIPDADNSAGHWAHNDPLQFAAEAGIIAPLLFYAFLLTVLIRTITAMRALPPASPLRPAIMGLFCALLAVALHSHTTFPLYILSTLIVCAVWGAAWYELTARALDKPSFIAPDTPGAQKIILSIPALCFLLLLSGITLSSAAGTYFTGQAQAAIERGRTGAFQTALTKARTYGLATLPDPFVMQAGLYIDLLAAPVLFTAEEQATMYSDALALLNDAQSLNPYWAAIDYKRGKLFLTQNETANAAAALQTAITKNPQHAKARQTLATLYMRQGRPLDAYEVLEAGLHFPHSRTVDAEFKTVMKEIKPLAALQQRYKKPPLP